MNNPLRFKAWDYNSKRFIKAKEIINNLIPVTPTKNGFKLKSNFHLLMSSCLNDKAGKEIYEGDIVRVQRDDSFRKTKYTTGVVWYLPNRGKLTMKSIFQDNQIAKFFSESGSLTWSDGSFEIDLYYWKNPKILGNVFQESNPMKFL